MFIIGQEQGKFDIESNVGLNYTGRLLDVLQEQSRKANQKRVFPVLGLDKLSKWHRDNQDSLDRYHNNVKQMSNVSKALALELLVTNFLSYHDKPREVRCYCKTAYWDGLERPIGFAGSGLPDISVSYDEITVIGEVSTKREPSIEHYKDQFLSAYKHAIESRKRNDKPVYCFMVNERSLSQPSTKKMFDSFTNVINKQDDSIKFISASISELAAIAVDLKQEQTQNMSQSKMVSMIKNLSILCQEKTSTLEKDWFQKTWIKSVSNQLERAPEPPKPSRKPPDESREMEM